MIRFKLMCLKLTLFWVMFLIISVLPASAAIKGFCFNPRWVPPKFHAEGFKLLSQANVKWIRSGFNWEEMEPRKDHYYFAMYDNWVNLAKNNGISILGVIRETPAWLSSDPKRVTEKNLADFEKFVAVLVTRYSQVKAWEIWNEPDIKRFWTGSPEEYVRLLQAAHKVIKKIDPSVKVVSAGLDGRGEDYVKKLLKLNFQQYCDAIGFHPYAKNSEKVLQRVAKFNKILNKHGVKKPLWITEVGWHSGGVQRDRWMEVKEEANKATLMTQTFNNLQGYIDAIFWYNAFDSPKGYGAMEVRNGKMHLNPAYFEFKALK